MMTALGYVVFAVTFGAAIGYRQARAAVQQVAAVKRRIDADIEFMKAVPTGMDWSAEE